MSETPVTPGGSSLLGAELTGFPPGAVTVRVIDALLKVLPESRALPPYFTLEAAADAAFPGTTPEALARARSIADEPGIKQVLHVARSIDTGDTGLTIVTGVRSALSLFFGGAVADAPLAQQRADAALKALGIAWMATKLIPEGGAARIERLLELPSARVLLAYYAAIEIDMPFFRELRAPAADPAAPVVASTFVTKLVESQSRSIAPKLLGIIGRQGVDDAQATLTHLLGRLDALAEQILPHTQALADNVKGLLPSMIAPGGGDVSGLVAAGADALPSYRYLVARVAVEACLHRARLELMPAPAPEAAPPPVEAPVAAPADPFAEPASVALVNPFAEPEPEPAAAAEPAPDEDAPPPPPPQPAAPEFPTEPLPAEQRMVGVFTRSPESWLVFTREGLFADWPAATHPPDWSGHVARGRTVGRYRRIGEDKLEINWPDGKTTSHALARDTYAITLDGESCRRADFNLQGQVLDGRWRLDNGATAVALFGDGTFAISGGDADLPSGTGRYTLATGAVALAWEDGRNLTLTLYSTLSPTARTPDRLLVGGRGFAKVG